MQRGETKQKTSKMLMCESMVINSVGLNCCRSAVGRIMIEIRTGVLYSNSTIHTNRICSLSL